MYQATGGQCELTQALCYLVVGLDTVNHNRQVAPLRDAQLHIEELPLALEVIKTRIDATFANGDGLGMSVELGLQSVDISRRVGRKKVGMQSIADADLRTSPKIGHMGPTLTRSPRNDVMPHSSLGRTRQYSVTVFIEGIEVEMTMGINQRRRHGMPLADVSNSA